MRVAASIGILLTVSCSAFAEDVKAVLNHQYSIVTKSMQSHDLSPIERMLTPDYRAIAPNGQSIGRSDVIKQFKIQSNSVSDLTWPRTIQEFHVGHGTALATVSGHLSAYLKGAQHHRLELVATTKDTWKKIDGTWLLKSSQLIKSKMTMDGKPMKFGS